MTHRLVVSYAVGIVTAALLLAFVVHDNAQAQTAPSVKCLAAATTFQKCVQTKYAACTGKTRTALANCMKEKARTGGACNVQSLSVCLSPTCQKMVTSFQACIQALRTCAGKKDKALVDCLKAKKVETPSCSPSSLNACIQDAKKKAKSATSSASSL